MTKSCPTPSPCQSLSFPLLIAYSGSDDDDSNDLERRKNLNSFLARQGTSLELANLADIEVYEPGATIPIWKLRTALEEPVVEGAEMEWRLWAATEWIMYYGDILFLEMHPKVEVHKRMEQVVATSELAQDIGSHSPERWEFWKKRLSELAAEWAPSNGRLYR